MAVGVSNLHILSNENDWCHSARVTSPGNIKSHANHSRPLFASLLANSRTGPTWKSTFSLFASSLASSRTDQSTWENIFSLLHWLFCTDSLSHIFEQNWPSFSSLNTEKSTKHYKESSSNIWTISIWEIILSSFIFPSKPTDPQRNKLDIFNSCFDFSILIPVLTTASQLLLWLQCLYSFSTLQLFSSTCDLQHKEFLSSHAVNKTSELKTINIFVNSFVLPFNISRANRTLQPQLPFLYKW